jgi:hypothetical protein
LAEGETIKIRIRWDSHYSTDQVQWFVSSEISPPAKYYEASSGHVTSNEQGKSNWEAFVPGSPVTLSKGDVFSCEFVLPDHPTEGMKRDYIIKAVGLYKPDYRVYSHLKPADFALNSNYPNPFNPRTVLSYDLPQACDVTLVIYNTLGQVVATLVDGHREAGSYTVEWDGSGVASGMYLYRLEADAFAETRKMILLK